MAEAAVSKFQVSPQFACTTTTCKMHVKYDVKDAEDEEVRLVVVDPHDREHELLEGASMDEHISCGDECFGAGAGDYRIQLRHKGKTVQEKKLVLMSKGENVISYTFNKTMRFDARNKRQYAQDYITISEYETGKDNEVSVCAKGTLLKGLMFKKPPIAKRQRPLEVVLIRSSNMPQELGLLHPDELMDIPGGAPIDLGITIEFNQFSGDEQFATGEELSWTLDFIIECSGEDKVMG